LNFKNQPNQTISTSVEVDGVMIDLEMFLQWNSMAGYWTVSIKDMAKDEVVISSLPLLSAINSLGQYGYLKIGSMGVVNVGNLSDDDLNYENFGDKFLWVWDNNV
jgi:hypothetical protein